MVSTKTLLLKHDHRRQGLWPTPIELSRKVSENRTFLGRNISLICAESCRVTEIQITSCPSKKGVFHTSHFCDLYRSCAASRKSFPRFFFLIFRFLLNFWISEAGAKRRPENRSLGPPFWGWLKIQQAPPNLTPATCHKRKQKLRCNFRKAAPTFRSPTFTSCWAIRFCKFLGSRLKEIPLGRKLLHINIVSIFVM